MREAFEKAGFSRGEQRDGEGAVEIGGQAGQAPRMVEPANAAGHSSAQPQTGAGCKRENGMAFRRAGRVREFRAALAVYCSAYGAGISVAPAVGTIGISATCAPCEEAVESFPSDATSCRSREIASMMASP